MSEKIIQISTLRINRDVPVKCKCKEKHFTVDTKNREITCECGVVTEPFEVVLYLSKYYEQINEEHRHLHEQRNKWIKSKPYSVLFKNLESSYQRGQMLPYCPKCDKLFDYKDIRGHGNAEFYRKLEARQNQQEMNF